jgi:cell division protein YceG involved in septum cleavage
MSRADEQWLGRLFDESGRKWLRFLAARLKDGTEAEDLAQEVYPTGILPFERLVAQVMGQEPYRSAPRVFWIMDNSLLMQVSDSELVSTVPSFVALKDARKPVEAYVFPDEYHIKWQPQHKLAVAERTIDWFQFWLQRHEDDQTAKTEQYVRWRKLRDLHGVAPGTDAVMAIAVSYGYIHHCLLCVPHQ